MKQIVFVSAFTITMALSLSSQASFMTHNYAKALAGISIDNACITETEVRSIKGETACLEYKYTTVNGGEGETYTQQTCVKMGKKVVVNSRSFTTSVCSEYKQIGGTESGYLQCVASKEVAGFLPATIPVVIVSNGGEQSIERASSYTFPACK